MTTPMTHQQTSDGIFKVNYPCYVAPVLEEAQRIVHIPGSMEYAGLEDNIGFVVEGYLQEGRLFLFDCIPLELWYKKVCNIPYEKRLKYLRILINSLANQKKVLDLPAVLIDNSPELHDYLDNLLTSGYKKARIMDVNGNYVFGPCTKNEYVEVDLEETIRQSAL